MERQYHVEERDGKTIVLPLLEKSELEYLDGKLTDAQLFDFFKDKLAEGYFSKKPFSWGHYHHCNKEELRYPVGDNIVLDLGLRIVDEKGNPLNGHPAKASKRARGVRLSSNIVQAKDLQYNDKGLLCKYTLGDKFLPQIESIGYTSRQIVYENVLTALMHNVPLSKLSVQYRDRAKPFMVSSGFGNSFYFFNPQQERLELAIIEFQKFMAFVAENKDSIVDVATMMTSVDRLTDLTFNKESEGGRFMSLEARRIRARANNILAEVSKVGDFTKLESLVYTTGKELNDY